MRHILLNPGPVSISDGVRKAAVSDDLLDVGFQIFQGQGEELGRLDAPDDGKVLAHKVPRLLQGDIARGGRGDGLDAHRTAGLHRREQVAKVTAGVLDVVHAVGLQQRAPLLDLRRDVAYVLAR